MLRRPALALALAGTALVVAACSSGSTASEPVPSVSATPATPSAPESAAPAKPSAAEMATDRFADAILEQIKIDSPDTFSDQLITIALSPLMRQLASTADITTRVASKGSRVTFTLTGDDATCVITVTDEPRARGVVCKAA